MFWVLFQSSVAATINSQTCLSLAVYDRYKGISAFQVTLHNVQIRAHKEKAWNSLPYMVMDEEIDNVIALWPPNWKISFKIGAKSIGGTNTSHVTPPVIIPDIRGMPKNTRQDIGVATQKEAQQKKDIKVETQTDSKMSLGT